MRVFRIFRWLAFAFLVLVSLIALLLSWFSFEGRRDWDKTKKDLLTRGEKLSLVEFIPPPIPEEENFFADPMWEELTDLVEVERNGFKSKEPRLPVGERQLHALRRPLTEFEQIKLSEAIPEFFPQDSKAGVDRLVLEAFAAGQTANPPARKRAAEFIMATLNLAEPVLSRLSELSQRPGAILPMDDPADPAAAVGWVEVPNYLMAYNRILGARVWAELTLGDTTSARRDALILLRVPDTFAGIRPTLLSILFQVANGLMMLPPLQDGLKTHAWSEADLAAFEPALAKMDFPAVFSQSLRGERGFHNHYAGQAESRSVYPAPYIWAFGAAALAFSNRLMQDWIDALDHSATTGLNANTISMEKVFALKKNPFRKPSLVMVPIPNMGNIATQVALLQSQVVQTRIVCALERHRLKYRDYPEFLAALVPEFLPSLPPDVITAQPMHYRRIEPGKFLLWSVGWHKTNEGGEDDWTWGKSSR